MAYLDNRVYDNGLTTLDIEATHLYICSGEPANYAGVAGVALGNKATPSVGAPEAGSPNGRQVTVAAITDGSVTATGTASHWALTDNTNSRLLAAGPLNASQAVTSGNPFTLTSFTIRIPAPA